MRQIEQLVAELFLIAFATAVSTILINNLEISVVNEWAFASYLFVTLAAALVVLPSLQTYRSVWQFTGIGDYLRILAAAAAIVAGAEALGFWFHHSGRSAPALPILQGLLILFFLVGVRVLARMSCTAYNTLARRKSALQSLHCESVLVIGLSGLADLYLRFHSQFEPHQIRIEGLLDDDDRQTGCCVRGRPILGTPAQILGVLHGLEIHGVVIDRIVLAIPLGQLSSQGQMALRDITNSTKIKVELLAARMGLEQCSSTTEFSCDHTKSSVGRYPSPIEDYAAPMRRPYWRLKRTAEPAAALGVLILVAPLILSAAILTLLDVGFPLTFWQLRPGYRGSKFKLYKFRTMAAAYDRRGYRVAEEERTSSIGNFLRLTRLDELPQLFNILVGEMSFIGPRPLLPIDQPSGFSERLLVRPGLTGWAQIKGGRDISPEDKAALDIWYIRNASLSLDIKILALTVLMIAFGEKVDRAAIRLAWQERQPFGTCSPSDFAVMQGTSLASLGTSEIKEAN